MRHDIARPQSRQNLACGRTLANVEHQRRARSAACFKRQFESFQPVVRRHETLTQFDTQSQIAILFDDLRGLGGTRIPQVLEFAHDSSRQPQASNVDERQNIDARPFDASPAKLRKIDEAARSRIHYRSDAVIETDVGVDAETTSFVPMAVQIDEPRTNILSGHVAFRKSRQRREIFFYSGYAAIGYADVHDAIDIAGRIDHVAVSENEIAVHTLVMIKAHNG